MSGNFGCDLCTPASMEVVELVVVEVVVLAEAGTVVVVVVVAPSCVGVEGRLSSGGSLLNCPLVIADG